MNVAKREAFMVSQDELTNEFKRNRAKKTPNRRKSVDKSTKNKTTKSRDKN